MDNIFIELSFVIGVVLVVSLIMRLLKQPLMIGYIIAGVLVGPLVLNIVHTADQLDIFAHLGIALLLFIIGLGLSPKIIKDVGKPAVLTGVSQVIFTTAVGWIIVHSLGYDPLIALYIAVALAFSSTIIVLKLLSDKREHHRLYAKISVGFLLVQDICAAAILIVVPALNNDALSSSFIYELIAKSLLLFASLAFISIWLLPKLKNLISANQEFLFIFAIAWGLGVGAIFYETGLSLEVGALAAGVALASQPYAAEIASRLRPLRDFFIVLFFVALGTSIELTILGEIIPQAVLLSLFVLIGNPIIVMIIMKILGFTKKTGFKAGLAVAQISEFSLIFIALIGVNLELELSQKIIGLTTVIALITITLSSYMIIYSDKLYTFLERFLKIFESQNTQEESRLAQQPELVLIGYVRGGEQFIKTFKTLKKPYLIIDYNPRIVEHLEQNNLPHAYGDISDLELIEEIGLDKVKLLISTISEFQINKFLADYITKKNLPTIFICSAETPLQAQELYQCGANYVMLPHYIGGEQILSFIKKTGLDKKAFIEFRDHHLLQLTQLTDPAHPSKSQPSLLKKIRKIKSSNRKENST
ncbi:MAG: cation:proton antiporter [Candidatus Saccharibacteria bacterium]|nr:cation:proton antiporter [Candidatus Saccharibacteria bacterium]